MKLRSRKSSLTLIWHRFHFKYRRIGKLFALVLLIALIVRSLPYFAPIHATDLAQDIQPIEFSDRHGLPLGTLLTRDNQHTAAVPLDRVSPHFIQAIIAAEDGRFYQHGAIDLQAIARAIKDGIEQKKVVSGASTITMQLARMLSPTSPNLTGKIAEIWQSWRLVAGMNREEILAAYINRLPMGGNIYGVEAASRIYFSIPAQDLNLAQASILAALPNNPTYFNPYTHWERLKQRQKYVLNQMLEDGYITKEQSDRAYSEQVAFQSRQQGIIAAPHFLFWLARQLPKGNSAATVQTTIDRSLQELVEGQVKQVVRSLSGNNVHHAAALVIDNHTGEVLAYAGSPDYFDEANLGSNDGVQALRQPGSTLKPFLYELGLENKVIRPQTILADIPTYYAIPGGKLYNPTDYNEKFLGPVRVRIALANSLNVPAVRVLEKVGVPAFLDRLHELGFTHLTQDPEHYGLGLALGSGEVTLWELAHAYTTLANQGKSIPIITSPSPRRSTATSLPSPSSPSLPTWGLIRDILSDRHARSISFGVNSVLDLPFPTAVKTGTSSNFRDTWTVGFTTDYTVATWVGNFNGDSMRQVSGVTGAAPLWNRIMLHLHSSAEPTAFPPPTDMVQKPICALSGLKPTSACTSIVQEYLYVADLQSYEQQLDKGSLPPEYNEWLQSQQLSPPQTANSTSRNLKILSPSQGDIFLMSSDTNPRLEFKLATTPSQPVEWWLNQQKIAENTSNSLFWEMKPGNWTLEVRRGNLKHETQGSTSDGDRLSFQVQLSNFSPTRRGFSIPNS
ncbi:penicillin-binding protein 1C [Merismopedia glauca]|uniref:Penicillin-binding protein 1C n=1 Tax=Merismopedia glauca CCAP 1448/3 TaxID=1296344 RepID=A0A2T1C8Z3_9CYAN|nr:penicillin-binding protein 1C [Merismopedia glauca]PSB04752.1 penicillin-binding protein 1C [Merismopedia glauca CCAP 1448/3]